MDIFIGRCRIPELLRTHGWTQQDLSERTGIDKRTISFYCTNRRKKMPLIIAVKIANSFDCDPRELYEWDTGQQD